MNKETRRQLQREKEDLFTQLWDQLQQEENQLREDFNTARNLACSTWEFVDVAPSPVPTRYEAERMDLLEKNFQLLMEKISRKRYFLVKAFGDLLRQDAGFKNKFIDLVSYWDEELKKQEPNLTNRFADNAA